MKRHRLCCGLGGPSGYCWCRCIGTRACRAPADIDRTAGCLKHEECSSANLSSSRTAAEQYEQDYLPHRLGNWMAPDTDKALATSTSGRYGTLRAKPAGTRTQFIVDERGHLLPGEQSRCRQQQRLQQLTPCKEAT